MRLIIDKKVINKLTKSMNKKMIAEKCNVSYNIIQNITVGTTKSITKELAIKLTDAIHVNYQDITKGAAIGYSSPKEKNRSCCFPCDKRMIKRVAMVKGNDPEVIANTIMKNDGIRNQTTFLNKGQILKYIEIYGI